MDYLKKQKAEELSKHISTVCYLVMAANSSEKEDANIYMKEKGINASMSLIDALQIKLRGIILS